MRRSTTKKQTMLLLAVLSCSAAMVGALTWKDTTAETAIDPDRFALVDGASVRLKEDDNGIRFQVELGANTYDSVTQLEGDVVASKAGMFVVPYTFVNNANAYESGAGVGDYESFKQKIDIVFYDSTAEVNKFYQDGDYYYANGAVVDMKFANLNVEYVGIGYIATTTESGTTYQFTPFTQADNARSIAFVAGGTYDDYDEGSSQSVVLENYVYGALLGEMETNAVTYDETSGKYTYASTQYDTVEEILTATSAESALALDNATLSMIPSTSAQLTANVSLTINGETKTIKTGATFTSSAPDTVSVSKTGELKALGVGSATITATTMGKTATCEVTVEDNRTEKTLAAADYDLSKKAAYTTTLDSGEKLISVTSGDTDLTSYASLDGATLSIPYSVMGQASTGVNEITIGTQNYVYKQEVTVATYVVSDKDSFDTFFTAMKEAGTATKDYYVVLAKNAVIDLEGASYGNSSISSSNLKGSFLGTLDGRGGILKNFTVTGQGGLFGQLRLNNADTGWVDTGATLKNFGLVNVTGACKNAGIIAYSSNSDTTSLSNIFVSGTITQTGTSVVRCMWGKSTWSNVIVNLENTADTAEPLFGESGTGITLDRAYAISNATTLYSGTLTNSALHEDGKAFFASAPELTAANGWSDVWSYDQAGNLCFGGNIVVTKPDTRTAKMLDETYYQKGSANDLTITLDAGEVVESMTVGSTNVTANVDASTAGQVTVPAAAIAALTTGEHVVTISTANYKYEVDFVYADLLISDDTGFTNFLTDIRTNTVDYAGKYVALSDNVTYSTSMSALSCTNDKTATKYFKGILDGRGYAISNLKVNYHVFSYLDGATIKDIAFVNLSATKGYSAFTHATANNAVTVENVFISLTQNGQYGQNGFCANTYTTTNVNNVVIVQSVNSSYENYGLGNTGSDSCGKYVVANTYLIGSAYSYDELVDSVQTPTATFNTTAETLLGDTAWLTADNGWNMDIWSVNTDGDLCFSNIVVLEKPEA